MAAKGASVPLLADALTGASKDGTPATAAKKPVTAAATPAATEGCCKKTTSCCTAFWEVAGRISEVALRNYVAHRGNTDFGPF